MMSYLDGITVLVLGLGESGLAMARWCVRSGARVRVWDSREAPPNAAALAEHVPAAVWLAGALCADALDGVALVLKSPGLSPRDERIVPVLRRAADRGIAVQGELDLFARALADLKAERGYAPKVIAITGTNGKTTTTAMTALLVERAGLSVAVAGNIGPTMLQTLADRLGSELAAARTAGEGREPLRTSVDASLPQAWILELSSFQLDSALAFEPDAAAILNLSEDHLDWHGDMAAYSAAKARVFGRHAVIIANRGDRQVEALLPAAPADKRAANRRPTAPRHVVRFGLDAPQRPGDYGVVTDGGMAWLARAPADDAGPGRRRREPAEPGEAQIQRLMPAEALRVRGRHNAANALAALALASSIGCPLAPMLHGLREYAGEPHRVQFIGAVNGVEAYDDSKGTNVGATVAALLGLGADKAPAKLVVILGGDGKGQDFGPLAEPVARHARAVATLGRDAGRIEAALAASGVSCERHATLEAATRWCFDHAEPSDAVLLSPACASLDMFRDYGHRAEVFFDEVRALAAEHGQVMS